MDNKVATCSNEKEEKTQISNVATSSNAKITTL